MAGHRKKRNEKLRSQLRNERWRGRMERAATAEDRISTAADRLRAG